MTILHSCFSSSNYQKCIIFRALLETGKTAKNLSTYYKERTRATARQKYCTREKRKRTSIIRCLLHIRTEFVAFYVLSLSVIRFCLHQDLILGELTGYCTTTTATFTTTFTTTGYERTIATNTTMKRAMRSAMRVALRVAFDAPRRFVLRATTKLRWGGGPFASQHTRELQSNRFFGTVTETNGNTNYAIVGLGNPGSRFEGTRHNAGFEVVDYLSRNGERGGGGGALPSPSSFGASSSSAWTLRTNSSVESETSEIVLVEFVEDGEKDEKEEEEEKKKKKKKRVVKVILAKPQTFMNVSGTAVRKIMRKYRVPIENVLVVYDDLDTKVGQIRIKKSGSHGGHNGIRDILDIPRVKNAFPRVRVGIGRPENESVQVHEHVLSRFREEERGTMDAAVEKAAGAVVEILRFGVDEAIARQNGNVPKNKNKRGGNETKKLKIKGGQPVALEMKVSEDGQKVEVNVFARSSRKKELAAAVAAVAAVDNTKKQ